MLILYCFRHALFFEVYYTIIEVFETENPLDVLKNNNTYVLYQFIYQITVLVINI